MKAFQLESRENLELAVRLADGWYHHEYIADPDRTSMHCGGTAYTVKLLSPAAIVPPLRVEYRSYNDGCDHAGSGHTRSWGRDETGLIAIGIGSSGTPSAPRVLLETDPEWASIDDGPKISSRTVLRFAWAPRPVVSVRQQARWSVRDRCAMVGGWDVRLGTIRPRGSRPGVRHWSAS